MSNYPNEINRVNGESTDQKENKSREPEIFDDVDLSVLFDFEEAQSEGEPDLIVELIDLYLADIRSQLSAIKDFILKADEVSLKRVAHNLKGSSANLGIKSIARLCEELEQMNFIESPKKTNVCFNRLDQAFARVQMVLLAERQNRTDATN